MLARWLSNSNKRGRDYLEGRKGGGRGQQLTATTARRASFLAQARFDAAEDIVAVGADFVRVDAAHAPVDCFCSGLLKKKRDLTFPLVVVAML